MVEMVSAIAVGDGRQINGATEGMVELDRKWDREKSGGWMGARSFAACEKEKGRGVTATRRVKDGGSDGKTVIVSESEDNYSDRGLHKRERSSRASAGAGIGG